MGPIATAALGIGSGLVQDAENYLFQGKMNQQQEEMNRKMMDYQQKKQLEMWKATSYGPQVEEMKKAGLNPALLYGMSGGGSQTTGAAMPQGGAPRAQGNIGMGIQNAMAINAQQAQIELTKAQAEEAKANAANIRGDKGTTGEVQTANLWQELDNKRWQWEILKAQHAHQELDNWEQGQSSKDRLQTITAQRDQAQSAALAARADANVKLETIQAEIDRTNAEAVAATLEVYAKEAGIRLTEEQIKQVKAAVKQGWATLKEKSDETAIEAFKASNEANYPGIHEIPGRLINDAIEYIYQKMGVKRPNFNQVPLPEKHK